MIAINKCDVNGWDETDFNAIKNDLSAYVRNLWPKTPTVYVPVSAATGKVMHHNNTHQKHPQQLHSPQHSQQQAKIWCLGMRTDWSFLN